MVRRLYRHNHTIPAVALAARPARESAAEGGEVHELADGTLEEGGGQRWDGDDEYGQQQADAALVKGLAGKFFYPSIYGNWR